MVMEPILDLITKGGGKSTPEEKQNKKMLSLLCLAAFLSVACQFKLPLEPFPSLAYLLTPLPFQAVLKGILLPAWLPQN